MHKFVFAYHGGQKPETPQAGEVMLNEWKNWMAQHQQALIDPGNPVGPSKTVSSHSISDDGGVNPLSGYTLVQAEDMAAALEMAQSCPHLSHGTIEVAEILPLDM
ncbi:MAG: hypothetical protein OEZ58_17915 [Gammaproteobacteria bacterium]|nr:hypothetical protein [Gammaproteobacteria bacterium]MDH5730868.1 hypothetical protein [Gammaproteobacteria bacterium]